MRENVSVKSRSGARGHGLFFGNGTNMKYLNSFLTVLIVAVSFLGTSAMAQDYRLRSGDLLRVEVLEDSSLNREVLVAPDGNITVPLAGVVRVGGTTIRQAQARLTSQLSGNFATTPNVLVSLVKLHDAPPVREPKEPDPLKIYVIGEVNKPGLVPVEAGTTLLQSLSMAGGVTDFAATKRIQLRRQTGKGTERIYRFNYQQVLEGVAGIGTTPLIEGDVIVVPARRLFE